MLLLHLKIQLAQAQPHSQKFSFQTQIHSPLSKLRKPGMISFIFYPSLPRFQFLCSQFIDCYICLVISNSQFLITSLNTMLLTVPYVHPVYLDVSQNNRIVKSKQKVINMELKKTMSLETKLVLSPRAVLFQDLVPSQTHSPAHSGLTLCARVQRE